MGMYTQLVLNFSLKKDVSLEISKTLTEMIDGECDYWGDNRLNWCFNSSSYYFENTTNSKMFYDEISEQYRILIFCDFKNYEDEIETFLEWVKSHIDVVEGKQFIGYSRYEECDEPTLYYLTSSLDIVRSD